MSRFYPHSEYAEDQPYPYTILSVHVLARGAQAGAGIGSIIGLTSPLVRRVLSRPPKTSIPLPINVLRSAGVGTGIGTGLLTIALIGRMQGKSHIEWADRSWRLLENKGQVEVDDWSLGGALLGVAAVAFSDRGIRGLGWRGVLGGAGIGSLVGTGGYMIWRHGIHGGKFD